MVLVDLNGAWPSWNDVGKGMKWIGNKISDATHAVYDNTIGKVVGIDQTVYEINSEGFKYEVTYHTGGDIFVFKKNKYGETTGWFINAQIGNPQIGFLNKQSISGKGFDISSFKYTNDIQLNVKGNLSCKAGWHIDESGIGIHCVESGKSENMPIPLPDGTKLNDAWNVRWKLTYEQDVFNWKQVGAMAVCASIVLAIVLLAADDVTVIGIADDGVLLLLCNYLAMKAPEIYQCLMDIFPKLQTVSTNINTCIQ